MLDVPVTEWLRPTGRVTSVGGKIRASLTSTIGELVEIHTDSNRRYRAEVIGFEDREVQLMPFEAGASYRQGNLVTASGRKMQVPVGMGMLGRVINAVCQPIDGLGAINSHQSIDIQLDAPDPLKRPTIRQSFSTGIRCIDGMLTLGCGQRVGLFAGSGVGKSTLLGEIAKYAESDVNIVAMIGERGREVRPFIEDSLGPDGLRKSIVIVSTSDQPPLARIRASEVAVVLASWFRSQGKNVLLMLDSLTRLAHAQRELGLLLGEPPTSRGYTPSVFQKMALLLEQLGTDEVGSITGLLTVLVDGDDMNDPVADSARSILDGHIVLDRKLAHKGHFPAIDVLASASRVFNEVTSEPHQKASTRIRQILAKYREVEDLIQIGAYKPGIVDETDRAIKALPSVNEFLRQGLNEPSELDATLSQMAQLGNG